MPALANAAPKNFNSKFEWLFDRLFHITIADPNIASIKSLHTSFVKLLYNILVNIEQNRMVRTIQNFELFELMFKHFWQSIDAILMTFLWLKMLDAKLLILKLSSFSVPKLTVIRHV